MDLESRKVLEMGYGGAERLTMNMGPQHPSSHGVFRAILTLEGETVVAVDAVIGYLHRCHEKLGESLTYTQYPSIASKTDYVAAMTSELAYVRAAEMIGKIDVPKRAQYLRVVAGHHPEVLRALRYVDLADHLCGAHVGELARHGGHVVGLRRDGRVLRVGERLSELLVAAVEVTNHRVHCDHRLPFQGEDGAEHPVRRRVLRPHVHGEALSPAVAHLENLPGF